MADFEKKVTLIEVDVDVASAKKDVEGLTSSILAQKDAIKANTDEIKALEKQNKSLQKEVEDGTKSQEEANKQIAENSKRSFELKKQNELVKDGIKDLNKERNNAVKVSKLQSNSLDALRKKSVDLKKSLNEQETATKTGAAAFDKMQAELKETNDKIRELDQGAGDFKTSVGQYPKLMEGAGKATEMFGVSLDGVFKMIMGNPIILIIAALTSLIAVFKDTQTGAEFFRKSTAALNTALGFLKDIVESVGASIIKAFSEPKKTFDDLVTTIKDGVLKYFTEFIPNAIDKVVGGLGLLKDAIFNLDLDAAVEGSKKLVDGLTDINPVTAVAKVAFEEGSKAAIAFGEAVSKATEDAFGLEEQLIANEKAIADQEVVVAQSIASQKELTRVVEDQNLTYEERIAAAEEFARVEAEQIETSLALASERVQILKDQNDLTNSTEEDIQRVRDAEIELANLRAASDQRLLANQKKLFAIRKQEATEKEKEVQDTIAREEELNAKLEELSNFRIEQEREAALLSAETEQEKLAMFRAIADEDFLLREEQLAEQEERLNENALLSAEERALQQADIDLEREKNAAKHEKSLTKIAGDEEKARLKQSKKFQKALGDLTKKGQQAVTDVFSIQANNVEKRFADRQSNLEQQLANGEITQEQFNKRSEALEKQKAKALYEIELKKFKVQKLQDLASAGVAIGLGIANSLKVGLPQGAILAAATGALGAVQIAAIASKQPPPAPKFAKGGDVFGMTVGGNLHSAGGTKYRGEDGNVFEVERDEGIFVTKREATNPALMLLDQMNTMHGGNSMFSNSGRFLQKGGEASQGGDLDAQTELLVAAVSAMPPPMIEVSSFMAGINAENEATEIGTI